MNGLRWENETAHWRKITDAQDAILPLLILRDQIRASSAIEATAFMLPVGMVPDDTVAYGLPVIQGDRAALIFEPPR